MNGECGALAVIGHGLRLGGVGDQRVGLLRLDLSEAGADRPGGDPALDLAGERVVAAGVEDDEPQALGPLQGVEDAIQRDRLVIGVALVHQLGVRGDQVIRVADLDAVAGIVDDGDLRVGDRVLELADRALEFQVARVVARRHHVEPGAAEQVGHRVGVAHRVGQLRHVLVAADADDERDAAPFGVGRLGEQRQQDADEEGDGGPSHGFILERDRHGRAARPIGRSRKAMLDFNVQCKDSSVPKRTEYSRDPVWSADIGPPLRRRQSPFSPVRSIGGRSCPP